MLPSIVSGEIKAITTICQLGREIGKRKKMVDTLIPNALTTELTIEVGTC